MRFTREISSRWTRHPAGSGFSESTKLKGNKVISMLDTLISMSKEVNRKIENDPKVRDLAAERDRIIVLHFTDENDYILEVKDGKLMEPRQGTVEEPTLLVVTDTATMNKILNKKLNPLMAYAMKKIKVKGPMEEVLLLKDFF
ncbi:MAG TPA: hypothetical protein ENK47_03615 [Euryarchaeota archaeon]|nr:MAG: hypothetical protein B6U90_01765 [Thermoplasmatales archaeon ex4484_6]RLF68948.1 MAG: hypothetical protein DRN57_02430 [Thermoplasmata archaeon]HHD15774.1 hypothetical protein [Euryarchaeota archaeon]